MSTHQPTQPTTTIIHPRPPGRPTKRTTETLRILFEAAAIGAPIKACCAAAGVSTDAFNAWRDADPDLQKQFDEARERGRVQALSALQRAQKDDWRAAAEWLRCAFPADYRAKVENLQAVQINQNSRPAITAAHLQESQERRKEAFAALGRTPPEISHNG